MIHKYGLGLLTVFLMVAAFWGTHMHHAVKKLSLTTKLNQIVRVSSEPVVDCKQIAAQHPFVILALGQSNAGNHGEAVSTNSAPILLFTEDKCVMATDPLPGSTGNGGSIWSRLPHNLLMLEMQRPVVLSVMGIDATSIVDWTDDQSPLRQRLTERVKSLKTSGLLPNVILWQHGEADAHLGTASVAYSVGMEKLADILTHAGSNSPVVMALSTVCRSFPNERIRTAIAVKAAQNSRFKVGPDTDTLNQAGSRFDGCHFSAVGLDQAARLWVGELQFVFASI